jgi:hypothetical protein
MPPVAQIVKCPNCSAPLEAPSSGGIVYCRYCNAQVSVTPQPRVPAPQPQYPVVPRRQPASAKARPTTWIIAALMGIGIVITAAYVMVAGPGTRGVARGFGPAATAAVEIAPSRLKEVTMCQTSAQLAVWAGVEKNSDQRLELRLEGSRFEALVFYWLAPHPRCITQVELHARAPIAEGDPEMKTAQVALGARFASDPDGGHTFESTGVRFAVNGRQVEIRVWPDKHPSGQHAMALLWQLAQALVLQEPVQIDAAARRDVLQTGYPLRDLAKVDPAVDVDQSESHLKGLFPGVGRRVDAAGLHYVLPLDNPWFGEAGLLWKNEKGSRLVDVRLDPPPFVQRFTNQTEIRDCLARRFGPAKDAEIDHLANVHSYQWQKYWPHASVYAGATYLWLELEDARRVFPVNLKAVILALADCTSQ